MDKKVKALWLKALRSGEFKQCRGVLCDGEKYCALGVLSVLALIHGECTFDDRDGVGRFDNKKFGLSFNVMRWANISQEDERYLNTNEDRVPLYYKKKLTSIAELNDQGVGFRELARIIEKNL
jgi:hypothetical protein